jgi:hypothetical protein
MIMQFSEVIRQWLGWCPNAQTLRTAPAVLVVPSLTSNPVQPAGGAASGPGRIRLGIGIAIDSIKTLFREKRLLWFPLLAGLVILFLLIAEWWSILHYDYTLLPYSIWIPFGDSNLTVFNLQLFLIEAICLSCFTYLLAGMILCQNGNRTKKPVTIRHAFDTINTHALTLATLSIVLAFVATFLFGIISQSQILGKIEFSISMAMFHLPYAYYFPTNGIFASLFSVLFFSFRIMVINILLLLMSLYIVPVIVLENKRLIPALMGSVRLLMKTWREFLGCILVFGMIVLAVAAIGLLIGQSPLLLNHDYDFFLQMSRGQVLMTVVCYGFLLPCGILMAIGSMVLGIAVTKLYTYGKTGVDQSVQMGEIPVTAEPAS